MTTRDSMSRRNARWKKRDDRVLIGGRLVAVDAPSHGVYTTYGNWHCRCVPCSTAHRLHMKRHRAKRRSERVLIDGLMVAVDAPVHNSSTYSNWSCRCRVCREDWYAMQTILKEARRAHQDI